MSLASPVGTDACRLSERWTLDPTLADMLVLMELKAKREFAVAGVSVWPGLWVISGFRTETQNREVGGAPNSRHLECPSRAADLRIGQVQGLSSDELWAILGGIWRLMGGRWGGTFATPDPNHFDLG